MSLTEKIDSDIKASMLAREKDKLESLRAIKAALLIAKTSGDAITPDTELKLLQRLVKQRRESAEIYVAQNRPELAEKEVFEAGIIEQYLPAQLDAEAVEKIIRGIVSETGASSIKDMGKVMAAASAKLAGQADNKLVAEITKRLLT